MQEEFNFTTEEDLVKNRRFQAIQLREQEVPEFRGLKLLPATEPEVPDDLFDVSWFNHKSNSNVQVQIIKFYILFDMPASGPCSVYFIRSSCLSLYFPTFAQHNSWQ